MNKFFVLLSVVLGCGSFTSIPGQEDRIDGDVMEDGLFNSQEAKEEFCSSEEGRNLWFCSEIGSLEQPWQSAEYHGREDGSTATCYGPTSSNRDCIFPNLKQMRLVMSNTGCYQSTPPPVGPTLLQEQAIIDGVKEGALNWDNADGLVVDVVMNGTPGTSWYIPVTIDCTATGTVLAIGGVSGSPTTKVSNLPVGPHGKDQARARTVTNGHIKINSLAVFNRAKERCGSGVTLDQIRHVARVLGTHEMGHVFGYGHFNANSLTQNIMYPFMPLSCNPSFSIQQQYLDGLAVYDSSSGSGTILDEDLETWQPE